ncbi:MAG: VIT and VWA domain-containing protein, partial [Cellvibrionaceae bacterium]|nr:VIT and VWA domain-containing protein [Cellvibrionaceae bacterium]
PKLDIKAHHVDVVVEDGYAITTVEQAFYNPHGQDLEALYSFPLPDKAALGEFTYWIDGKAISGEVIEKEKARQIYAEEKSQGREVALGEQDDYRSFDIKVFPVRAQSEVKIRLSYIQAAQVDMGMGRYVYPLEEGGVDDKKLSFWSYDETVKEAFSFNMTMRSSYPIEEFRLPEHPQAIVNKHSAKQWQVGFQSGSAATNQEEGSQSTPVQKLPAHTLDKDIVVYWRHQPDLPGSVDMVSYKEPGSNRGTFMLTLTPGDDLPAIEAGRDWTFVLDISGSMQGKYASLVDGVNKGLQKLRPNDRFRMVLFNNRARELTPGFVQVNAENIAHYTGLLSNTRADGGTDLYRGLERGFDGLDTDRPSAVLLVTDGVANVGITEKKQFLKLLQKTDVRLFSFVMGNSANKPLLDGMSKASNGFAMAVSNSDDIVGRIIQTTDKLSHEAYRDISIDIKGKGIKVDNVSGNQICSLYRGQQLIVFGHYRGDGDAKLDINVKISGQQKTYTSPLHFPAVNTDNPELERLWAFASIEKLQNHIDYFGREDGESRAAIIDLALEYGLVTNYTSMVVMREEQFKKHNIQRTNQERLQKEADAKTARETQPVRDHRQDSGQPAFNNSRPNLGSGSF